jgi:WD40 repeat protein
MSTETSPFDSRPAAEALHLEPGAEPVPGYRLEKLLGRGGFGEVWRAEGPGGVAVALKFIRTDGRAGGPELRSLEMMKGVRHGNLLTLLGVWQREPFLVLALELADRSLLDRLKEAQAEGQAGIPAPELLEYLRDAARALDFLNEPRHTQDGKSGLSIQHRDVKPHNLLLVGDTVKLADFGLARLLERQATSHTGAMTPAYAAPEFFKGQTTTQSDQYSLAVTYCQLRGGRLPFAGTPEEMMMGHSQGEPDLGMVPEAERPAVARALRKNPEERWPNSRAFVQALAGAAQVPLLPGNDATMPNPSVRTVLPAARPRRRRWPWLVAGGVLLVLLLGGGVLAFLARRAGREAVADLLPARPSGVTGVAFSPDGARRISVGEDAAIWQWDQTRPTQSESQLLVPKRLHRLEGVTGMVASPDGCRLLTNTDTGVELWDVETGQKLRTIVFDNDSWGRPLRNPVHSKAFSPDGRYFAVGYGYKDSWGQPHYQVGTWDLDSGKRLKSLSERGQPTTCVAVSSDGGKVLAADRTGVDLWDPDKSQVVQHIDRGSVLSLAFAPDGSRFLIGEEFNTLLVMDAVTGKELRRLKGHTSGVSYVVFTPDGKHALSGGWDRTVRLWDVETGNLLKTFRQHSAPVTGVAVSPDGKSGLSASKDGSVWLWSLGGLSRDS